MNRLGWLVVCVLLFAAAPLLARTWTDTKGQTVEGDFVRVMRAKVLVSVGGKTIQIPFGQLITEDQDYVRDELKKHGLESQVPAKKKPAPSDSAARPDAARPEASRPEASRPEASRPEASRANAPAKKPVEDGKTKLGSERTWTDILGRTVRARLIGMDDAKVVLQVKGKSASFPFDKFSMADQQYVRWEMMARGEGDKVPAEKPANVQSAPPPHLAQTGPPAGSMPAMARPPQMNFPTFTPPPPMQSTPVVQPPPYTPPVVATPSFPRPVPRQPFVPAPTPSYPTSIPSNPPDQPAFADQQVMVKICENCKHIVPNNLTAGDRCPNCGVYFGVDRTNGKTANWVYFTTPGGIGAVVISLVVWAVRRKQYA